MDIKILNESLNKYFYDKNFFSLAKNNFPEFRRIITKYFQQKGLSIMPYFYSSDTNLDFKNLEKTSKDKREKEVKDKVLDRISMGTKFSSATNGSYEGSIRFPSFIYKESQIKELTISTNENFFEDGHDLLFVIKKEDKDKKFYFKINLMRPMMIVLDEIFNKIEECIQNFDEIEDNDNKQKERYDRPISDIDRIFNTYLQKRVKRDKKGNVSFTEQTDKSPVEYSIKWNKKFNYKEKNPYSTYNEETNSNFSIEVKIRPYNPSTKYFQGKYSEKFQEMLSLKKEMDDIKSRLSLEDFRLLDDEHEQLLNNFKFFCFKVFKLGYVPEKTYSNDIEFKYVGESSLKRIENNPTYANKLITKRYNEVYNKLTKDYISTNNIPSILDVCASSKVNGIVNGFSYSEYVSDSAVEEICKLLKYKVSSDAKRNVIVRVLKNGENR